MCNHSSAFPVCFAEMAVGNFLFLGPQVCLLWALFPTGSVGATYGVGFKVSPSAHVPTFVSLTL